MPMVIDHCYYFENEWKKAFICKGIVFPLCKDTAFPTTSSNEFRKEIKICFIVSSTYSGCDGFIVN